MQSGGLIRFNPQGDRHPGRLVAVWRGDGGVCAGGLAGHRAVAGMTRSPSEVLRDIHAAETLLAGLKREMRAAKKVPLTERNRAIVNDALAGTDHHTVGERYGVHHQVVANVIYKHRLAQQSARLRTTAQSTEAAI